MIMDVIDHDTEESAGYSSYNVLPSGLSEQCELISHYSAHEHATTLEEAVMTALPSSPAVAGENLEIEKSPVQLQDTKVDEILPNHD
jgi:hypothetical protein